MDCNKCNNINITEMQQRMFGKLYHHCTFYNKRILHNTPSKFHYDLCPCSECVNDEYKNFVKRKGEI